MTGVERSVRILTVCTHNRTRSVMMETLLRSMLVERLGAERVVVASAGFGPPGMPAIPEAVEAMERRGFDVSMHRSRPIDAGVLADIDLVLTAERDHVVRVASIDPAVFRRTMTLPEFLTRSADDVRAGASTEGLRARVQALTSSRTALAYLRDPIEEIADPTGTYGRTFEAAVAALEAQCSMAANLVVHAIR